MAAPPNNSKPWLGPPLAPARDPQRQHYCTCSWGSKCTEIRKILLQRSEKGPPDPRAGKPRGLSLRAPKRKASNGDDHDNSNDSNNKVGFGALKQELWRRCIETSLGTSFASWSPEKLEHVPVARHHWTRRQNEFFDQSRSISRPMTREEIIPLLENGSDDLNETFSLKKKVNRKEHTVYFIQPSVTMESLMSEIAPKLQDIMAAAQVVQQEKERHEKFNELRYQDYCAKEEAYNVQSQELAAAKERQEALTAENQALRDQVAALEEQLHESNNSNNKGERSGSSSKRQRI